MIRTLVAIVVLSLATGAAAQFEGTGEIGVDVEVAAAPSLPARAGWTARGHVEARFDVGESSLRATLDPSLRFAERVEATLGLTEAYLLTTVGGIDASVGIERLPLERARLSVPYTVEEVGPRGERRGVPGLRAVWYPSDGRVRAAVFWEDGVVPLVSVRRDFDAFDVEATVLYRDGLVAGLGGSGLVGDVVVYGEAWLRTRPWDGRGALGASGFLGDSLWTVEAAYAPLTVGADPVPHLAGTTSLVQTEDRTLEGGLTVAWPREGPEVRPRLAYVRSSGDSETSLALAASASRGSWSVGVRLGATSFFRLR